MFDPTLYIGVKQADALGERFKRIGTTFEQVYSSVAERAMQTGTLPFVSDSLFSLVQGPDDHVWVYSVARTICEAVGYDASKIVTSPLLLEQSQGEWERKIREHIYTKDVKFAMNTNNWEFKAPGRYHPAFVVAVHLCFLHWMGFDRYNACQMYRYGR